MANPQVTIWGNLVQDPELRFTNGGTPVCSFTVAVNLWRGKDKEQAVCYHDCIIWKEPAEHFAESVSKGNRVIVVGEQTQRSYENKDGQTVWVKEIVVEEAGPATRFGAVGGRKADKPTSAPASPPPAGDDDVPF